MWKNNQKKVSVYRSKMDTEGYQKVVTHETDADKGIEQLTIQDISTNKVTVAMYGLNAKGRIRIKLCKNQSLNLHDKVVYDGNEYIVDTETTRNRLFDTVECKWHSKAQT